MKNLLIFVNPEKKFTGYNEALIKIQIDNSLSLGWKKEDILLITNFDYEYNGIKAIIVSNENYCEVRPRSTKTATIPELIKSGIIKKGEVYWCHDLDAYELNRIGKVELEGFDIGLTDYGYKPRLTLGSFFLKDSSLDIFEWIRKYVFKRGLEDESMLGRLMKDDKYRSRFRKLNITYNFAIRNIAKVYEMADKPLKVLHFRPEPYRINQFMYGENELGRPLMTERLIDIFKSNGIK